MTSDTLTITTTFQIPAAIIENIIETAGYGIAYWARRAKHDDDAQTYDVWPQSSVVDDEVVLRKHHVTYQQLADALAKVANGGIARSDIAEWAHLALTGDDSMIDSDLGDVVVQVALFDQIVFG